MKKTAIKVLCAILALLTVLPMLFACNNTTPKDTTATQTPQDSTNNSDPGDSGYQDIFEVPDTNYDGAEYNVLSAGPITWVDFGFDDNATNVLEQAQYKREMQILNDYGVSIVETTKMDKSSSGSGVGYQDFYLAATSNSLDYHLGLLGTYDAAFLAAAECLYDINALPYVNTKNS